MWKKERNSELRTFQRGQDSADKNLVIFYDAFRIS